MNGISKICIGVITKILDFTFAGYGLVCDGIFLKIIFHHLGYQYNRYRNLVVKYRMPAYVRELYTRTAEKLTGLMNLEENEKWYFRGR